jgi:hypothetical protein
MPQRRAYYIVGTHWDREWHMPFQDFRYYLVRLFDRVLAGLEDGRLAGPFQVDGQYIPIEDYLQVRPERRAQVERLARAGKLFIGPWYSMPDEFTVSGEALIRNLRVGRDMTRDLGGIPSNTGYVPDMFGHNSQLPQIFAGFGIPVAYIWRGVNNTDARNMIWRGADGTEIATHKFGPYGYGTYAHQVRHGHNRFEAVYDPADFAERLQAYLEKEAACTDVDAVLVLDSCDHQEWDQAAYALVRQAMANSTGPFEIVHTDLDAYNAEMLAQRDRITTVIEGELRDPGRASLQPGQHPLEADTQWLIPGTVSSRINIKQANAACQTLLCHWAEPFAAFAGESSNFAGAQGFLDLAWRYLMTNHAHDSIDGCSIDQVHRDMLYRFDQCRQIAERITKEATYNIAARVEGELEDGEQRVTLFNPLPVPFEGITEVRLEIPAGWPTFNEFFGFEPKPAFRMYSADGGPGGAPGVEIPYQRLSQAMHLTKARVRPTKFPENYQTNDVTVALPVSIPAMGYTTLIIRAGVGPAPTRHPETPGMTTGENSMANEHLNVVIEANGTLTVTDKWTGETYTRLLTFEDRADIGDGWYHGPALNDQVFVSTAAHADIALIHDGPYLTTFRVRTTMNVPADFRFDRMVRSAEMTPLVIDSYISLRPNQHHLDVHTVVENTADDHRLRVLFPSGARAAQTYMADSAFDVVERPIALREDNYLYRELEIETKPQQSWTAVYDGGRGLAVIGNGLLETAVRDLPERPLALTLFRGTRRTVFTEGEPGGQVRGTLEFDYQIAPLAAPPDRARLSCMGQQLAAGFRAVQLRPIDLPIFRSGAPLPSNASFLRVDGPAVVTSARRVDGNLEVRLFNPDVETVEARLNADGWPGPDGPVVARPVDFESRPIGDALPVDGDVTITLTAKKIVTMSLLSATA